MSDAPRERVAGRATWLASRGARAVEALRRLLPGRLTPRPADLTDAPEQTHAAREVRELAFRVQGAVDSLFSGEYASAFRGQGLEFSHLREYEPGDDVRAIDWNVTARRQQTFVKQFIEERELTVTLIVDVSASTGFGVGRRSITGVALEMAAVLALSAARSNDRTGLILVSDEIERVLPAGGGRQHVLRLLTELSAFRPSGTGTRLSQALELIVRSTRGRGIVFIISDFVLPPTEIEELRRITHSLAKRQDVVPIRLFDPVGEDLPDLGPLVLVDPESGRSTVVDSGDPAFRDAYRAEALAAREAVTQLFRELEITMIEVEIGGDYVAPLMRFFRRREGYSR